MTLAEGSAAPSKEALVLPSLAVAYRPEILVGDDFGVFLRPAGAGLDPEAVGSGILSCSWRLGRDYLIYDRPLRAYGHALPRGEWSALGIPWPNVTGLLTFELMLRDGDGRRLVASGEVLAGHFARLRREGLWVYGWAPAPERSSNNQARDLPDLDLRFEPVLTLDDGTLLTLLSLGVDTVAPPEFIRFARFPYDFGGGRFACSVPHGPESATAFLLPVSRSMLRRQLAVTIGTLGGLAASAIDLGPRTMAMAAGSRRSLQ